MSDQPTRGASPRPGRKDLRPRRGTGISLLVLQVLVAASALAGGAALVLGALVPELATVLSPPTAYLEGSPFSSYLVPGLVLGLVVGGTHAVAFLLGITRSDLTLLAAAVAAIALLIWVFVQMVYIPFSFLQAIYFAVALAEAVLTMLALGLLGAITRAPGTSAT
ncbi:hypothetical protein [Microbacterium sulfonylureivorans]|uniref:hypothetical protein n=1 Tax=Microbacterium sulfonylureivorans TaxID=2486854 RepID=UPI001F0C0C50|nr:hypothetical protein [Microbacterium sulfonylureivorans]